MIFGDEEQLKQKWRQLKMKKKQQDTEWGLVEAKERKCKQTSLAMGTLSTEIRSPLLRSYQLLCLILYRCFLLCSRPLFHLLQTRFLHICVRSKLATPSDLHALHRHIWRPSVFMSRGVSDWSHQPSISEKSDHFWFKQTWLLCWGVGTSLSTQWF